MNFTRVHITAFLALSVIAWLAVLQIQGTPVSIEHLAPFGTVVGVLAVIALTLEHVLWRQPWLHGWFVNRPDLRGTWHVTLQSDWINPDTKQALAPIICYMGVEQTLSKLQMHLMTPESESWFVAHGVRPSPSENGYQVVGVYTNKPHVHLRGKKSDMHLGAIVIDTHGPSTSRPDALTAEYWTDRKTTGRMTFAHRNARVFTRYEDANAAFRAESSTGDATIQGSNS